MKKNKANKTISTVRIRVGRLDSVENVARYQARLIKRASKPGGGDSTVNDCYKLCVMASMMIKSLEVSDLEKRIKALEENHNL